MGKTYLDQRKQAGDFRLAESTLANSQQREFDQLMLNRVSTLEQKEADCQARNSRCLEQQLELYRLIGSLEGQLKQQNVQISAMQEHTVLHATQAITAAADLANRMVERKAEAAVKVVEDRATVVAAELEKVATGSGIHS